MFVIVVDAQPVCRKRHCISAALLIVQSAPARASSLLLSLQHDFLKAHDEAVRNYSDSA